MTAAIQSADDLRARIRELAATEPDPAVITTHILRSLSGTGEARVVVAITLHEFVRATIRRPEPAAAGGAETRTYETTSGARTASPKVAALRNWIDRELRRSICVDEAASTWKFLADCTTGELLATSAMRRRKAAATLAEAEHYEDIAKAIEHAGVDTVGALPRDTLEKVLKR